MWRDKHVLHVGPQVFRWSGKPVYRDGAGSFTRRAAARALPRRDRCARDYNPICASMGGHLSFHGEATS
jgi:hypothetical protein